MFDIVCPEDKRNYFFDIRMKSKPVNPSLGIDTLCCIHPCDDRVYCISDISDNNRYKCPDHDTEENYDEEIDGNQRDPARYLVLLSLFYEWCKYNGEKSGNEYCKNDTPCEVHPI